MDTQAISPPSTEPVDINAEYPPFSPIKRNVFTDREREELKEIIREVLDGYFFWWIIVLVILW